MMFSEDGSVSAVVPANGDEDVWQDTDDLFKKIVASRDHGETLCIIGGDKQPKRPAVLLDSVRTRLRDAIVNMKTGPSAAAFRFNIVVWYQHRGIAAQVWWSFTSLYELLCLSYFQNTPSHSHINALTLVCWCGGVGVGCGWFGVFWTTNDLAGPNRTLGRPVHPSCL